jgi:hypothetical protein
VKFSGCLRRECAACSHAYLSGEIRVGEMTAPVGVWSPIMCLPKLFQGEDGGTREAYGPDLGIESLSGSPSSRTIWRRGECGLLVGRAGDEGACIRGASRGGDAGHIAGFVVRVGACADELRLMEVILAV